MIGVTLMTEAEADVETARPDVTFDELYRTLWWQMLRVATGLVDEVGIAEDVVQDAFAALYTHWHSIRDRQSAVGYLRRSVVNASRSTLRRRMVARKHLHLVRDESADGADESSLWSAPTDSGHHPRGRAELKRHLFVTSGRNTAPRWTSNR
jgi:DNA-directed RNA polymerase specialized sigma24 family protein